jgi:GH35 family endo-1,4-beta-xylanase
MLVSGMHHYNLIVLTAPPYQIVAEAKKIGGIVRGHNFVWHAQASRSLYVLVPFNLVRARLLSSRASSQTPFYVNSITNPEQLKAVYRAHVEAVAGRYKDDWVYLDVINERESKGG